MKIRNLVALSVLVAAIPAYVRAQDGARRTAGASAVPGDVPQIVLDGFAAYRNSGMRAALDLWLKTSPVAATANMQQLMGALSQIEGLYGRMIGYDVLRVVHVGTRVRRVYFTLLYEKGPLYGYIDCYQTSRGWVVPGFLTNSQPGVILPPDLLTGDAKATANPASVGPNGG
jgi:hypothetical protein